MRMFDKDPNIPKALNNHSITRMTTTTFKIFLIFPSMGMYEFASHSKTPTMMSVTITEISGMIFPPLLVKKSAIINGLIKYANIKPINRDPL
jgi:hypothetical protein